MATVGPVRICRSTVLARPPLVTSVPGLHRRRPTRLLRELVLVDPHAPLATAAAVLLAGEWQKLDRGLAWPLIEAGIAAPALLLAWQRRDGLRLAPLLALGLAFQLAWIAVHIHVGFNGDPGTQLVYTREGHALLHGDYPHSPYPSGAVALFAFETWAGAGATRTSSAFAMVPFQLLSVLGIWTLRTRWSPWIAAFVAFWPLNTFFWEFRFDLVPTAALVVGLALANRGRWHGAGWALGLGAVVKWTPALTAVALGLWLLASGRRRSAGAHVLGFAIPVLLVTIPLLLLRPHEALAPYTAQSARSITGESLPYLPLRLLGLGRPARHYYGPAIVPSWSNGAAMALQALAVLAVIALVAAARTRTSAVGLAAVVPAVFLLTNKIFSPQFFVLILAACAVAAALLVREAWELLVLVAVVGAATIANTTLYPGLARPVADVPGWTYASAAALLLGVAATGWLVDRGLRRAPAGSTRSAPK